LLEQGDKHENAEEIWRFAGVVICLLPTGGRRGNSHAAVLCARRSEYATMRDAWGDINPAGGASCE